MKFGMPHIENILIKHFITDWIDVSPQGKANLNLGHPLLTVKSSLFFAFRLERPLEVYAQSFRKTHIFNKSATIL